MEDFEVISSYTSDDGIEDGVLYHPYAQRWPWLLITNSIHAICSKQKGRTYDQCLVPLLIDVILLVKSKTNPNFPLKLDGTVAGEVWIMNNEKGGLTVMLPSDY
jgi:hypothetical protein